MKKYSIKRNKSDIKSFAIRALSMIVILYFLFGIIFGVTTMKNSDMHPQIHAGDLILYYRLDKNYVANDVQDDEEEQVIITIPKHDVDRFGMELLKFTLPLVLAFFIGAVIFISNKIVFDICIFLGALCSGVSIGKYVLFRSMTKGDKND